VVQVEKTSEKIKTGMSKPDETIEQVKQLILDMPIQWSSTYGMLYHAVTLREVRLYLILPLIRFGDATSIYSSLLTLSCHTWLEMSQTVPNVQSSMRYSCLMMSGSASSCFFPCLA
jgi:hypothetical protein